MKPEDKQLLIKDLCARLPYGVKFKYKDWDVPLRLTEIHISVKYGSFIINERIFEDDLDDFKPYLRSMSSMTDEERAERIELLWEFEGHITEDVAYKYLDWLNAHNLDYRGLIGKGLAIEAPKDMYK